MQRQRLIFFKLTEPLCHFPSIESPLHPCQKQPVDPSIIKSPSPMQSPHPFSEIKMQTKLILICFVSKFSSWENFPCNKSKNISKCIITPPNISLKHLGRRWSINTLFRMKRWDRYQYHGVRMDRKHWWLNVHGPRVWDLA